MSYSAWEEDAAIKRLLLPAAALGVVLFLAASAVFGHLNLHLPRRLPGTLDSARRLYPDATWKAVTIMAKDGAALEGWFGQTRERSGRCVVLLHGITDTRSGPLGFAPMFLDNRYDVLLPDSRGHGASGGDLVTYGLLEKDDLLGWVRWVRQAGCRSVYALGESLGAAILLETAGREPVFRAVIAECAFADLQSIAQHRLVGMLPMPGPLAQWSAGAVVSGAMWYARLRYGLHLDQASPATAIARSKTPTFLIHGLADNKTPPTHAQRLARANPDALLWLVPGAGHTAAARTDPAAFQARVLQFFAAH